MTPPPKIDTATRPSMTTYMRNPIWPSCTMLLPRSKYTGSSLDRPSTSSASRLGSNTTDSVTTASPRSVVCSASLAMVSRSRPIIMLISISANSGFLRRPSWNCLSSSAMTRQAVFVTALALRGACVIEAISPKICPVLTVPMTFLRATRSSLPSSSRYILSRMKRYGRALSCSAKTTVPCATSSGLPAALKNSSATAGL